jgi:hypothetical protein
MAGSRAGRTWHVEHRWIAGREGRCAMQEKARWLWLVAGPPGGSTLGGAWRIRESEKGWAVRSLDGGLYAIPLAGRISRGTKDSGPAAEPSMPGYSRQQPAPTGQKPDRHAHAGEQRCASLNENRLAVDQEGCRQAEPRGQWGKQTPWHGRNIRLAVQSDSGVGNWRNLATVHCLVRMALPRAQDLTHDGRAEPSLGTRMKNSTCAEIKTERVRRALSAGPA